MPKPSGAPSASIIQHARSFFDRFRPTQRLPVIESYVPAFDFEAVFLATATHAACRDVLEVGTRQSVPGVPTHLMAHFPMVSPENYARLDCEEGPDVDVVGDVHALPGEWSDRFDAFVARAVWEHLKRPWVAATEVARVLKPGGRFLVVTHQCFPLHGYPSDYFRFSPEALRSLFEDAGLLVEGCDYKERCAIVPPPSFFPAHQIEGWNQAFPSFMLVGVCGSKPA